MLSPVGVISGGIRRSAARRLDLNKRTPAENRSLSDSVPLIRLVYCTQGAQTPQATASLGSELHSVRSLCTSYYHAQIACRHRGGQKDATEHDTDQNLTCRPAAASERLGGHAGAACQRRDNGRRGHRRTGPVRIAASAAGSTPTLPGPSSARLSPAPASRRRPFGLSRHARDCYRVLVQAVASRRLCPIHLAVALLDPTGTEMALHCDANMVRAIVDAR